MSLEALARDGVEAALAAGAGDAEAWVESSTSRQIRVYDGEVESLSDSGGRGIGIRAFIDGRTGYAYGTDLEPGGLRAVAERAHALAAIADPDEYAGLPDETGTTDVPGLESAAMGEWDTERKVELALAVDRAARSRAGVSQVENTVYSDGEGTVAIANSRGFAASATSTQAWAYSSAFAGQGEDLMTGMGIGLGRDPGELDPEAIGLEAADRALALVGARQPSSRRCPVVLDAFVAASFAGFIGAMLSADSVQRGRSLFAGKQGEEVAEAAFVLTDDGRHPDGPASSPFDGEGAATRRTPLIAAGKLDGYLYDSRTARKDGRATTGNAGRGSYRSQPSVGTNNLIVEPGSGSLEDLVAQAGEGLYVTEVSGLHSGVNPVSGTFSVGASGRLIEGGELGTPVREITIASDLVGMLKAVRAVGGEPRWIPLGGSVQAVPLLIGEMSVSGS
ncbi:MAG TPA: TldD/PmbA family protein [Thermoleophilaceae bacterium]|nr:TldD/PmbA family protein [Thermoleophilaceae bacterium]